MKKFLTVASLTLLTVLLALTFAGCGGGVGKLQKAYEKEGYTCTVEKASDEDIKEMEDAIKEMPDGEMKDLAKKELDVMKKSEHLTATKDGVTVVIVYTPNLKDNLKDALGAAGEAMYNAGVTAGTIIGDYQYEGALTGPAYDIFKANA